MLSILISSSFGNCAGKYAWKVVIPPQFKLDLSEARALLKPLSIIDLLALPH